MEDIQAAQIDIYRQIKNLVSNFKKSPKERITSAYLETRMEMLESYWIRWQDGHDLLIKKCSKKEKSEFTYFANNMYDDCLEVYMDLKENIKEKLSSIKGCITTNDNIESTSIHQSLVKLPSIQIPKFSGDYKDWLSFHDLFQSLVHENNTLSKVNKCQYLKSSLSGEAENLVKQISVTASNYDIMWEILTKRYHNHRNIVNTYLGKLLNQRKINYESAKAVKELLDTTSECLMTLKSINVPTDNWDDIIVYIVVQKLDSESHKLFEQRIDTIESLPKWKDLAEFLNCRFRTLEAVKPNPTTSHSKPTSTTRTFTTTVTPPIKCLFCNEDHRVYTCKKFILLNANDKQQFIQKNNACFNCLRKGHSVKDCKLQVNCRKCSRKHHTLLHGYNVPASTTKHNSQTTQQVNVETNANIDRITLNASIESVSSVILATALVEVKSHRNYSFHTIRALVDQGSQASLITEGACQRLGLTKTPIMGDIVGVNSNKTLTKALVSFEIVSRHNSEARIKVNAFVLKHLTSYLPQQAYSVDWPQLNRIPLADPSFTQPGRVDLLLGAEVFADIINPGLLVYRNNNNSLVAQETSLGWLISGTCNNHNNQHTKVVTHHTRSEIDTTLRRFWELEEPVPGKNKMTNEEVKCEEHYKSTHRRLEDGRYEVCLPFVVNPPDIGESESIALRRLRSVENKFKKYPDLQNKYNEFLRDYLEQKHMEPTTKINNTGECYLPHHAVINEQHLTTKLRVVFDASAKTSNGKSLNDNLMIGAPLQSDIRDITLRWRTHEVVLVGDIRQMYRQINIAQKDRYFQQILWRFSLDEPVQRFRLSTVSYGTSCAPYLAIRTLKQLAEDERCNFPDIVIDTLLKDFYMDDLLTGTTTPERLARLQKNLVELLGKGVFKLHKWISNCSAIEDITEPTSRKILGIDWNNKTDKFELSFNVKHCNYRPTKRTVLRDIASLYDPAGWLSPVVVRAKVFLQKLWIEGLDWDDRLPETLEAEWVAFRQTLCNMTTMKLDRWLGITENTVKLEIHGFSDASDVAYSAVVYCRMIQPDNTKITIIESKTRVAPVKKISTPKLELCGAVLLANLLHRIQTALNIPTKDVFAWTDSTIVLAWLQRPSSYWKTFVANRVTEITNLVESNRWHHVESQSNPADVASRGASPLELQSHELWWYGPSWLHSSTELPVNNTSELMIDSTDLEIRSQVKVLCNTLVSKPENIDIISRFSNFKRMIRVISYCMRFYYKCKSKLKREDLPVHINTNFLNTVELKLSLKILIKLSQTFEPVIRKNIINLNPFEDRDNILRVGGRIQNSNINIETKHPIILAKDSRLAYLIVKDAHQTTLHGGNQLMLNYIRNKYHIISVKTLIKRIVRTCVVCCRHSCKPLIQLMGNLPKERVTPQRPFSVSGVDFAGPVILKLFTGRCNRTQKAYIALFICTATKAVHLELVTSLSTESFIAAFRRFISRRGHCKKLISDCGTNFVGAAKEIKIMFDKSLVNIPKEALELLSQDGTDWQFNPPGAPHMGGLWESAIKSVKKHLNRVIGDSRLSFEEYATLLCQIESILNSRPLTSLDNDSDGTSIALTPGHFLLGENPITVPEENLNYIKVPYNKRWIYLQQMLQSFWRTWSREYLLDLQKRFKWQKTKNNIKIGDIVLVMDERLPPTKWLMGKVLDVHCGVDKLVRVVSLKCKNTIIKRPIHKLCPLPIDE